jgi:hypothetical protein
VWSLLWDVYDGQADANDSVSLGFKPIWNVLIGEERTTPALTSVFSFMTALKSAQPNEATAINTLLNAQNITGAGLDAFASTETHAPTPVASNAALPVYTTISTGTPVTVRSVDDAGHYNMLGNRRFLRYTKSTSTSQTVSVSSLTANADPDTLVYLDGTPIILSQASGSESFTISTAGTYVFDVYECANGCSDVEGTPGDYDITVTIN